MVGFDMHPMSGEHRVGSGHSEAEEGVSDMGNC